MGDEAEPQIGLIDEVEQARRLVKGSDSVELKLTVPETRYRSGAVALGVDPLEAQIRQVFFFDTPDLALNRAGVVARARRVQGREHDSVVKLRPVVPDEVPAEFRASPNMVVEVDAMPGGYVCSASMKGKLPPKAIHATIDGGKPLRKLFSKEQRAFFAANAPDGLQIDDLAVLGPIFVLKLKLAPETFSRRIVVEMWLYPDGTRVVELSTKCLPGEGLDVIDEVRTFLESKGIDMGGEQQTKTKTALEFFSAELLAQLDLTGHGYSPGGQSGHVGAPPTTTGYWRSGASHGSRPVGGPACGSPAEDLRAGGRVLEDVGLADLVGGVGAGEVRRERREHDRAAGGDLGRPPRRRARAGTPTRAGRRRCGRACPAGGSPGTTIGQPLSRVASVSASHTVRYCCGSTNA